MCRNLKLIKSIIYRQRSLSYVLNAWVISMILAFELYFRTNSYRNASLLIEMQYARSCQLMTSKNKHDLFNVIEKSCTDIEEHQYCTTKNTNLYHIYGVTENLLCPKKHSFSAKKFGCFSSIAFAISSFLNNHSSKEVDYLIFLLLNTFTYFSFHMI